MPQILSLVAYPGGFPHSFDVLRLIIQSAPEEEDKVLEREGKYWKEKKYSRCLFRPPRGPCLSLFLQTVQRWCPTESDLLLLTTRFQQFQLVMIRIYLYLLFSPLHNC